MGQPERQRSQTNAFRVRGPHHPGSGPHLSSNTARRRSRTDSGRRRGARGALHVARAAWPERDSITYGLLLGYSPHWDVGLTRGR
ncbi:hypothetical protein E2562_010022 [Oryza meyeriana var. granulata]|uniref:Uncharacterized protein n=1 Tax=Oryza meyeriana var. granulata TaxID=110450 RepID=A0A6G1EHW3_9ORYZ|nr:hypothetical protein E2562_010022 [Oryza meyeriana var. granulata]